MITFTMWLDPQWELALDALTPQIEAALAEGLLDEADMDDVLWVGVVQPNLHIRHD